MFESFTNTLWNPLIQKAIWSVVVLILVFLLALFVRRFLNSLKVDAEKKLLYRKWVNRTELLICLVILIRIWAYDYLIQLLDPSAMEKLIASGFGLLFISLIVYLIRWLIYSQKTETEKRHQYSKWVTYAFVLLYVFILIRIWAYTDLFTVFKNPAIEKLFKSGIALGLVYLALFFVRRLINSLKIEIQKRHQYRKRASYVATLVYVLILIPIWAGSTQQWVTVLSVMGAGVALALHEVLLNRAGWVYIVVRRPYRAGDRIELGSVRGDVIDIQLFQTTLLEIGNWVDGDQSTGRVVHFPHGQIFRNPMYNYTKGFEFLWNELSILVTFESNWEKAKEILLKYGEEESREIQEKVQRKIDRMARVK